MLLGLRMPITRDQDSPRSEIVGSRGNSNLIFLGTSTLFSIGATPFHVPTNSAQVFQFLYSLANTYYCYEFWKRLILISTPDGSGPCIEKP